MPEFADKSICSQSLSLQVCSLHVAYRARESPAYLVLISVPVFGLTERSTFFFVQFLLKLILRSRSSLFRLVRWSHLQIPRWFLLPTGIGTLAKTI